MSSTLRLFLNNNRISTAVKTKSGALLQVYPEKKTFAGEADWQVYWKLQLEPKIILRIGYPEDEKEEKKPAAAPAPRVTRSKKTYPASEVIFNTLAQLPPAVEQKQPEKKVSLSDWDVMKKENFSFEVPAGNYYIGDLCYALSDEVYDNIFGGTGYSTGVYKEKSTGHLFAVGRTAWGDGEFEGSDGRLFGVDSGTIGICSAALMKKSGNGGHLYTFGSPVKCHFKMGWFTFFWDHYNSLDIHTD
jgi:hypothetical protein